MIKELVVEKLKEELEKAQLASKSKSNKEAWDLVANDLNWYNDETKKALQEKADLSKDFVDNKFLLEQSQLEASHQVEISNIRKAEVEQLKRERNVVEKEQSSLVEHVSSLAKAWGQDLKTIAFFRNSLIEMEKAQQEDEDEEEEGEEQDEDGEEYGDDLLFFTVL